MIIITGASRGLGKAIAERLIERGEEVVGLARSVNGLNIKAIECDVSDYKSVKDAYRKVKLLKKPVKAFINAAGVASMNMAVTTNKDTVQKLIQTNLVGTIYCCQLFAPILLRQKYGSFINFSTILIMFLISGVFIIFCFIFFSAFLTAFLNISSSRSPKSLDLQLTYVLGPLLSSFSSGSSFLMLFLVRL